MRLIDADSTKAHIKLGVWASKENIAQVELLKEWIDQQPTVAVSEPRPAVKPAIGMDYKRKLEYENKALRYLVDIADEAHVPWMDFFEDEYTRYENEIVNLNYLDTLIFLADKQMRKL